jgi:hypothetical protein
VTLQRIRSAEEARSAAQRFRERARCDSVLITRGEHGIWLLAPDGEFDLPAEAREVSDVTGAGDTVIAAMALGLAAGGSLRDAARLANRAAGLAVAALRSRRDHRRGARRSAIGCGTANSSQLLPFTTETQSTQRRTEKSRVVPTPGCPHARRRQLRIDGRPSLFVVPRFARRRVTIREIRADFECPRLVSSRIMTPPDAGRSRRRHEQRRAAF